MLAEMWPRCSHGVFLLQGCGERRWSFETSRRAAADERLQRGLDVRVLSQFEPDEAEILSR